MRAEVKKWAKEHVNGNKWNIWQAMIVVSFITSLISSIISVIFKSSEVVTQTGVEGLVITTNPVANVFSVVAEIALLPLTVGLTAYVVSIVKGNKEQLSSLFNYYNQFLRIFIVYIIEGLIVFLYSLLLIIPGIIKSIAYSLVGYILADPHFKDLEGKDVLDLSEKIMDGHKSDYFVLGLHYVFHMILGIFTLGIYWIWVIPEMNLAFAKYATDLLEDYKKKNK